jgi:hypothetical protein
MPALESSPDGVLQVLESSPEGEMQALVLQVLESSLVMLPGLAQTRPTQIRYPLGARLYLVPRRM